MARSDKKTPTQPPNPQPPGFERMARAISQFTGSTAAFLIAVLVVLTWAATGPLFHYSENWQLVINTGTTIVTFLMVFLIQRTQNKDSLAVQLKLNEIVASLQGASNRLVNVEDLSEGDLSTLHRHYQALAEMAKTDADMRQSHSVDEAQARHRAKAHHRRTKGGS
jgi:low affinity Fe/Cu permease